MYNVRVIFVRTLPALLVVGSRIPFDPHAGMPCLSHAPVPPTIRQFAMFTERLLLRLLSPKGHPELFLRLKTLPLRDGGGGARCWLGVAQQRFQTSLVLIRKG